MTKLDKKTMTMSKKMEDRLGKWGYIKIHEWIRKTYGKANKCEFDASHKSNKYEWANKSGSYKQDISDWVSLCPSCHRKLDYKPEYAINMRIKMTGNKNSIEPVAQYTKDGVFILEKIPNLVEYLKV